MNFFFWNGVTNERRHAYSSCLFVTLTVHSKRRTLNAASLVNVHGLCDKSRHVTPTCHKIFRPVTSPAPESTKNCSSNLSTFYSLGSCVTDVGR